MKETNLKYLNKYLDSKIRTTDKDEERNVKKSIRKTKYDFKALN